MELCRTSLSCLPGVPTDCSSRALKYDARQYMDRLYQDDFAGESFLFRVLQAQNRPATNAIRQ